MRDGLAKSRAKSGITESHRIGPVAQKKVAATGVVLRGGDSNCFIPARDKPV